MQNAGASQAAKFLAKGLALVASGIVASACGMLDSSRLLIFTLGNIIRVIPEASESLKLPALSRARRCAASEH